MYRRPASASSLRAVLAPPAALVLLLLLVFILAGCNGDEAVAPIVVIPSAGPAPVLEAEPPFTPGQSNSLTWSVPEEEKSGPLEFLVQRSGDPLFADEVVESDWVAGVTYEFTDLEHGLTQHFRVRGRNAQGAETPWSESQASTQDAVAPVAALTELKVEQTSLLFTFMLAATDDVSGVQEIELWFGFEGADPVLHGTFPPGEVSFQATEGGNHEFTAIAVDVVGNRQDTGDAITEVTLVPEPIIIIDRNFEEFDITAAVLEYRMAEQYWEFGLGRYTIRPIIDPLMIGPSAPDYPLDSNTTEILGVAYGDDVRAYKIGDLPDREVVDDVVNGTPIAVCY